MRTRCAAPMRAGVGQLMARQRRPTAYATSMESAGYPMRERKAATPSRRCTGPENRSSARLARGLEDSVATRLEGPARSWSASGTDWGTDSSPVTRPGG
eukprot:6214513-Pleurochrysis_carterae.AAC.1